MLELEKRLNRVRWFAIAFAFFQVTFGRGPVCDTDFQVPVGCEPRYLDPGGYALVLLLILINSFGALTLRSARPKDVPRLGIAIFVIDHLALISFVGLYMAYQHTTTWALFLLLPLEGATRYGRKGALISLLAVSTVEVAREFVRNAVWGYPVDLVPGVSFRVGIFSIVALVSGGLAHSMMRDRKLAEDRAYMIENAHARLSAIIESLGDGLVVVDRTGRVSLVNPTMARMIGKPQEDIEGEPVWESFEVHQPDGRKIPWDQRLLHQALETRQVVKGRFAETLIPRVGEIIPTDLSAAPILDERGELLGAVQVVRDLRPEAELEKMKGALMASVSHEFRTPLAVIRGFGELLHMGKLTPPQITEAAKQILSAYERLSEVIEDLLILSGIEKGTIDPKVEDVDLSLLIQDYISSQGLDSAVRVELDGHGPHVSGDVRALKRVLKTLLTHALKTATSGSLVDVFVRTNADRVHVEIGAEQAGSHAGQDSPKQVPDEDIAFPLHIAQKLIELHRGTMRVGSKASSEPLFSFSLPVR